MMELEVLTVEYDIVWCINIEVFFSDRFINESFEFMRKKLFSRLDIRG